MTEKTGSSATDHKWKIIISSLWPFWSVRNSTRMSRIAGKSTCRARGPQQMNSYSHKRKVVEVVLPREV